MQMPTEQQIAAARLEMEQEDRAREKAEHTLERETIVEENNRRSNLPSEHPEHMCGMMCDGQDGWNSDCARVRRKLFS